MRAFKRILSCILLLSLFFSIGNVFAVEQDENVCGASALGIVNALGIAKYSEEELSEKITRGEFFYLACKLSGFEGTKDSEVLFNDLSPEHEFEPYIKTLARLGVIGADKSGGIKADESISIAEASAVVLKLAGYGLIAESKGGFPSGYINTAKKLKMYSGIDGEADEALTKGIAVQLIKNSLEIELITPSSYTLDGSYTLEEGGTFLWAVFKTYHIEDVVNGVDLTRLVDKNDIPPFHIQVGELLAESRGIENVYEYLGCLVDLYYIEKEDGTFKAVYMQKSEKNKEIAIDIEDINEIKENRIEFYQGDNLKSCSFKRGIPVIYNGTSTKEALSYEMLEAQYSDGDTEHTGKKHGTVRLLDSSGDGEYDTAFVEAYENFVVSYVNIGEKYIYDKYEPDKKLLVDIDKDDP